MPLFSAKLDYALRAVADLALQQPERACQSREIAARQNIRGPYLDQILAVLKREGIVRSIRGAGGGYTLAKPASHITVADVVQAVVGDALLIAKPKTPVQPDAPGTAYVVYELATKLETELRSRLESTTIADLVTEKQRLDDALSLMPSM